MSLDLRQIASVTVRLDEAHDNRRHWLIERQYET
jgi:hypothetical protein